MSNASHIVAPIALRSNEYWGGRSGTLHGTQGRIFRLTRMGGAKGGNAGPRGWKLRPRANPNDCTPKRKKRRGVRNYANKKLH